MTLSTKVTPQDKIELGRLADSKGVSKSEFMYNLVMCFKDEYDYIGRYSKKELICREKLEAEKKKNNKLIVDLENADYRVEMERDRANVAQKERDEYRYQIKDLTVDNEKLKEEIKKLNELNGELHETHNNLKSSNKDFWPTALGIGLITFLGGTLVNRK